jgi:hypothetical protein
MASAKTHRVFVSYSHKDRRWLEELLTHLAPFRDSLDVWADSRLDAGQDWNQQITKAIEGASVAVVLVSADFLASKFLQEVELPAILEAAKSRGMIVLPILIGASLWRRTPLAQFQFLNPPDKPLAELSLPARSATFVQIAERLSALLDRPATHKAAKQEYSEFAREIAQQVSELLRSELPAPPKTGPQMTSDKKVEDSKLVFIICAFSPDMEPVVEGVKAAANQVGLTAKRVKDILGDYQITSQIMSMIATARLVVADLTHERPNVYFELGYARGMGKTVVTCAREGTDIHFDVKDWTYIPYADSRVLEKALLDRFTFELEKGA